jgi:hypothetical protein
MIQHIDLAEIHREALLDWANRREMVANYSPNLSDSIRDLLRQKAATVRSYVYTHFGPAVMSEGERFYQGTHEETSEDCWRN